MRRAVSSCTRGGGILATILLCLLGPALPAETVQPISRGLATLKVTARDAISGSPVPVRFYLTDPAGAYYFPEKTIAYDKNDEHHFVAPSGSFQVELPAGPYTLVAERGAEFHPVSVTLQLAPGASHLQTVELRRWIDMNRRGWYSADLHNHRKVADVPSLMLAEDLNVAPTLSDWIWEDKAISNPPKTTDAIRRIDARHVYSVLDKEVERLERGPGAVDLLGLKSPIPFDGYRFFPPNDVYSRQARAQGGWVDAEKILWRDGAALAALGLIDFVGLVHNHFNRHGVELETEPWGMIPKYRPEFNTVAGMPLWSMDVYYRLLNCGFRLAVSAGSASGVKAAPLGYNRVYAKVDAPFSYQRFFQALKTGRSFATNGPMLLLTVNGRQPGSTLRFPGGAATRLRVRAEAIGIRPLDRMEIVFRGKVIRTLSASEAANAWVLDFTVPLAESGWLAARCFEPAGRTIRFAHTSPVYVQVGSNVPDASADAKFFIEWIDREIAFYQKEPGFREPRHREEMLEFFRKARAVYAKMIT